MKFRLAFAIPVLLLLCSFGEQPGLLSGLLSSRCDLTAYYRSQMLAYFPVEEHTIISKDGSSHRLQYLQKNQFFYLVIDNDTFMNSAWEEGSVRIGDDTVFIGTNDLSPMASDWRPFLVTKHLSEGDTSLFFQYTEGRHDYITVAQLKTLDLNADGNEEGIAFYYEGWYNKYYFFGNESGDWKYRCKREIGSRDEAWPLDLHLNGLIGFPCYYHACLLAGMDIDYYRFTGDSLQYCFSVGDYFSEYMMGIAGPSYEAHMEFSGKSFITGSQVSVHYTIDFFLNELQAEASCYKRTAHSVVHYTKTASGPWTSDNVNGGSHQFGNMFYPEIEMMHELCRLKTEGAEEDQFYLSDLDCDIGFYR